MLRKNNFSGGTDGGSITTANSGGTSGDAFTKILGGTPVYSSSNATGSHAPMVARSSSGTTELYWESLTLSARTVYARWYAYLTAYPTSASPLFYASANIANINATVRINTNGTLFVTDTNLATVTGTTTSAPIPLNQWVRIEARITVGTTTTTGTCELRVYHTADSTTITESKTASGQNFSTSVPTLVIFDLAGPTYYLDDIAASDVDWIGPDQLNVSLTPATLTGTWSLPALTVSTGSGIAPSTLTGVWSLPDPEITTADGLVAVNPNILTGTWTLPAPTVQAYSNVTVTPDTLLGAWQVFDPVAGVPVNPGDGISGPGQVEWNGFLFGGDGPYRPQQLDGWVTDMPGLDSGNVAQPSRHGSYPGRKLAQERQVTLSGLITATPEDIEQAIEDLIQATPVLEDDTELPLAIRVLSNIYVGYGSVTRRSVPLDMVGIGKARMTIQWTLSDPVLLSQSLSSAVIGDGDTQTLTNLGNAATYPLIRIPGPSTNPAVEIQRTGGDARVLEFNTTVPSGQMLIIDTYYGTALLGGTDVISTLSGTSVPVFDLVLAAGASTVTYDGGGSGPDITVLWRHAYL